MKKWLVVLALVACGSKRSSPPKLDDVDRSCKTDAECTLTGHLSCCDRSCGTSTGTAVNARAWLAVSEAFRPDCKGQECHVMCQKAPDCRNEAVAICKQGRCEKEMRPTEACARLGVVPDEYCEDAGDCAVALHGKCCIDCAAPVVNTAAAGRMRAEAEQRCTAADRAKCGEVNCAPRAVSCREHRCVEGM